MLRKNLLLYAYPHIYMYSEKSGAKVIARWLGTLAAWFLQRFCYTRAAGSQLPITLAVYNHTQVKTVNKNMYF